MRKDLDVALVRAFLAVVDSGGVTAAAAVLNLSQAAASQQIKRLEELLDCRLFERAGRRLVLAPAGERLEAQARRLMAQNDELLASMRARQFEGEVRFGVPYDIIASFSPLAILAENPFALVVHPSVPVKNIKELVVLAKARPGQMRHGSTGIGSPHHLAGELFKSMADVKMIHVPYKGATPAITDVVAGHIEIYFGAMVSTVPHVKNGRLRALAMTSAKRSPAAPDIPTLQEQGFKNFETGSWFGLHVPAGTPRDVVAKLHAETLRAINLPDIRNRMQPEGAEFIGDTPEQFAAYVRGEIEKWGRAVKVSGAKAEG